MLWEKDTSYVIMSHKGFICQSLSFSVTIFDLRQQSVHASDERFIDGSSSSTIGALGKKIQYMLHQKPLSLDKYHSY